MGALTALPVALPLLVAALLAGLNRVIPRRAASLVAMAASAATLACCIELYRGSLANTLVYWFGGWQPRHGIALGISFAIDPLGAGLAALASLLVLAGLLFSSRYFDTIGNLYHVLMLVFLAAMCGFALTGDLFNLFVFFELMSAAAYGLCGYKTEDPAPVQGAFNFAVTNTVGAYFVLTGISLVYARTGALNMAQIGRALAHGPKDALVVGAFTLIACGFLVKAAVVPFHFWLADAHAVAPAPVCILFSGVMVELGLYAVTRVYWSIFSGALGTSAPALRAIFATFGVITALAGAAMCFSQHNLKRLLAFSTISHMGVMLIGFGLLNPEGLAGTALYVLGHAGAKGALFLCAGIVLHRCQSVDERELKLKLAPMPFTAAVFLCGAAALAGTPLSGIAAGAALMHEGAQRLGYGWIAWIVVASGIVTSGAVFRFVARTYAGWGSQESEHSAEGKVEDRPDTKEGHNQTSAVMWIPAMALAAGGLLLGVLPHLQSAALAAAVRFEDRTGYARRVLDGVPLVTPASFGGKPFDVVEGTIAILAGIGLALGYLLWEPGRKALDAIASPLRVVRKLHSGHVGDYVTWLTFGVASFGLLGLLLLRS